MAEATIEDLAFPTRYSRVLESAEAKKGQKIPALPFMFREASSAGAEKDGEERR